MSFFDNAEGPGRSRGFRPAAVLTRFLNPRYAWLPSTFFQHPVRIVDAGVGPKDAVNARRVFTRCWFEGINIADLPGGSPERRAFDRYHLVDLDQSDLSFVPDGGFDYVICSHTIEHLDDGIALVARLCTKLRPGGRLYLEWPSVESQTFPLRGFGLNFFDNPMHKRTFSVEAVASVVQEKGLEIAYAGRRRVIARMVLAPVLVAYHALRARRLTLYDLWDIIGSCYAVHAMKPQPCGDSVALR